MRWIFKDFEYFICFIFVLSGLAWFGYMCAKHDEKQKHRDMILEHLYEMSLKDHQTN